MHKPKVEYFDLAALTNTDPKGNVRQVEEYRLEPFGLYMARPAPGHPNFHYLESWFLPGLSLRATIFHFTQQERWDQDYYLDIGEFGPDGDGHWRSVDHYLDILVRTGRTSVLLDVDELLAAHAAGYLDAAAAERAVNVATTAIEGIASHGHSFENWLAAQGITLDWKQPPKPVSN
ncbi:DUF402 domain-containing protein [Nocardia stercoris]|uniref:DUF402 domain-containing protein n=1 Tax=Nocardia stercoris TaxID=2483361 RepID=UPI0018F6BD85|nr:DUF402 domain-containing protein [Nocardia stercoris]